MNEPRLYSEECAEAALKIAVVEIEGWNAKVGIPKERLGQLYQ